MRVWSLSLAASIGAVAVLFCRPTASRAACGAATSPCKACHEVRGVKKVLNKGRWHKDHAFGDYCTMCHGGTVSATKKTGAHKGRFKPLGDVRRACASCHPVGTHAKAQVYAAILGVKLVVPKGVKLRKVRRRSRAQGSAYALHKGDTTTDWWARLRKVRARRTGRTEVIAWLAAGLALLGLLAAVRLVPGKAGDEMAETPAASKADGTGGKEG